MTAAWQVFRIFVKTFTRCYFSSFFNFEKVGAYLIFIFSCYQRSTGYYCSKKVHIRSFSVPYFLGLGLNREIYSINLRIQSKWGKIRTRKTPNTDTFSAVISITDKHKNDILRYLSYYFTRLIVCERKVKIQFYILIESSLNLSYHITVKYPACASHRSNCNIRLAQFVSRFLFILNMKGGDWPCLSARHLNLCQHRKIQ